MAIDVEEFISIFLNGRATTAFGPIPPGILGFETQKPVAKDLTEAKKIIN